MIKHKAERKYQISQVWLTAILEYCVLCNQNKACYSNDLFIIQQQRLTLCAMAMTQPWHPPEPYMCTQDGFRQPWQCLGGKQEYPMLVLRNLLHVWEEKGPPACAPAEQGCTAIASQPAHTAALLYPFPVSVVAMLAADCALCSASQPVTRAPRQLLCCATWRQDLPVSWAKKSLRLPPPPEHTPAFFDFAAYLTLVA